MADFNGDMILFQKWGKQVNTLDYISRHFEGWIIGFWPTVPSVERAGVLLLYARNVEE